MLKSWENFLKLVSAKKDKLTKIIDKLVNVEETTKQIPNTRVIIFDAIDSGFSINNIISYKDILKNIVLKYITESIDSEGYVIVSANSYEMAAGEQCFDVIRGKYRQFVDYEDYKKFILETSKIVEKRYSKQE